MSQGGVESQHRMKNRFSDCRPRRPNEHIMQYRIENEELDCSLCGRRSYSIGVCAMCAPVFRICKTCAESRKGKTPEPKDDHNSNHGRTANEPSSSRSWSSAPYDRPTDSWGSRGSSSSTGRSNSEWWDSAGNPQTWSRSDSQQGSRWQGGWHDHS